MEPPLLSLPDPASRCSSLRVLHKCLLDHSHGPQPSLIPFATPWGPAAHGDKGEKEILSPLLGSQQWIPGWTLFFPVHQGGGSCVGLKVIVQTDGHRSYKIRGLGPNWTLQHPSAFPEPGAAHLQ